MIKKLILSLGICYSLTSYSFTCFVTLVKDDCWTDFNVTVTVTDADTNQSLIATTAVQGKAWNREKFTCQPGQKLKFEASFTPIIWESEAGKIYSGKHYWQLPNIVDPKETAWDIPLCYSQLFSSVPFPPTATGNCACNFAELPVIPPQS